MRKGKKRNYKTFTVEYNRGSKKIKQGKNGYHYKKKMETQKRRKSEKEVSPLQLQRSEQTIRSQTYIGRLHCQLPRVANNQRLCETPQMSDNNRTEKIHNDDHYSCVQQTDYDRTSFKNIKYRNNEAMLETLEKIVKSRQSGETAQLIWSSLSRVPDCSKCTRSLT